MWCMLAGRRMEAKLNTSLHAPELRADFAGLPEREKPIVTCAFRHFLLASYLGSRLPLPADLDLGVGLKPILRCFGCEEDQTTLVGLHRMARDYYAYGVLFIKPGETMTLRVLDPAAFVEQCLKGNRDLAGLTTECGDTETSVVQLLSEHGQLIAQSRYDVRLDDAFSVTGNVVQGSCDGDTELNAQAVAFLREAGTSFSEGLYAGFREFKDYFDARVSDDDTARWLADNGVEVYVRGTQFNLRASRSGTPDWWSV